MYQSKREEEDDDGEVCFVMEYCDGGTLEQEINGDVINNSRPEYCLIYMLSILYGIVACQKRGINMHRDIKP
jgi:serine/threonine protein kinase